MTATQIYSENQLLPLSGIQHYVFCPRQWALITLEQQWDDNHLTIEGDLLHKNVDNAFLRETNGSDIITLRGLRFSSFTLGLTGIADAVEIHPLPDAPRSKKKLIESKRFIMLPVEYKRGRRKITDCDRLQLTAQAMILEETFGIDITRGAIFYWQERHREYVDFSQELRQEVLYCCEQMHHIVEEQTTPLPAHDSSCRNCSLLDICIPAISNHNVSTYLKTYLDETSA